MRAADRPQPMRMRMTIEQCQTWATVDLAYWDEDEQRNRVRTFRVGAGGYVRDEDDRQVCEQLDRTGSTLMATPRTLASIIRREYRAMRRAEARERRPRY
jgi:hypothetical protein